MVPAPIRDCTGLGQEYNSAKLLAKAEACDRRPIAFNVLIRQVGEEPSPLPHQLEESSPRVEVVLVSAKMISEAIDSFSQQRDLNFRRSRVTRVRLELRNDRFFLLAL